MRDQVDEQRKRCKCVTVKLIQAKSKAAFGEILLGSGTVYSLIKEVSFLFSKLLFFLLKLFFRFPVLLSGTKIQHNR